MPNMTSKIERMQLLKEEALKRITPEWWDSWTEGQRGSIILSLIDDLDDYNSFGYKMFIKAHKEIIGDNNSPYIKLTFSFPKLLEILDLAARYANVWIFS